MRKLSTTRYQMALGASSAITGYQTELQSQEMGNKEYQCRLCETDSDWSEIVESNKWKQHPHWPSFKEKDDWKDLLWVS
jgi:hypothetical protein